MFFLIIFGLPLVHVLWWSVTIRAHRRGAPAGRMRWIHHGFAMAMLIVYGWVIVGRAVGSPGGPPVALLAAAYIWFLIVLPWGAPLAAVAALAARRRRDRRAPLAADASSSEQTPTSAGLSRREVLAAGLAAFPAATTVAAVGFAVPQLSALSVRRLELPLADLPPELDGLTIAHVSDTHAGRFVDARHLRRIADAANELKPDLVCFTGDLIDFSLAHLPAGIDMLRRIEARHGLFMCEGNHDLFEDRVAFTQRTRAAGVGLLSDEAATIQIRGAALQVLGTRWAGRLPSGTLGSDALGATLALREPGAFSILLAHHPHSFDRAAAAGVPLTLSGHTHGGQLMLGDSVGAGPLLFKYWSGLYRQRQAALVVSNGAGNWFPLRIQAPAEIIHLTLRCFASDRA